MLRILILAIAVLVDPVISAAANMSGAVNSPVSPPLAFAGRLCAKDVPNLLKCRLLSLLRLIFSKR
jgi:hypothetical protein